MLRCANLGLEISAFAGCRVTASQRVSEEGYQNGAGGNKGSEAGRIEGHQPSFWLQCDFSMPLFVSINAKRISALSLRDFATRHSVADPVLGMDLPSD